MIIFERISIRERLSGIIINTYGKLGTFLKNIFFLPQNKVPIMCLCLAVYLLVSSNILLLSSLDYFRF